MASPATADLNGAVTDDGLPSSPGAVTYGWTQISGPGTVTFGNAGALATTATFTAPGTYVLRLSATDGQVSFYDDLTVTVNRIAGDASLNGDFDMQDIYLVIDWLLGRVAMPSDSAHSFLAADVSGDGNISLGDLIFMIFRLLGLITKFPVEL